MIELATFIHDNDGYPTGSSMPPSRMHGCKAPHPICVDHGWACESQGWYCTAPVNMIPIGYPSESDTCPARVFDWRPVGGVQTPERDHAPYVVEDAATIRLLAWVKRTLACISASEHAQARLAACFLHDGEMVVEMADLEALGSEMIRRVPKKMLTT